MVTMDDTQDELPPDWDITPAPTDPEPEPTPDPEPDPVTFPPPEPPADADSVRPEDSKEGSPFKVGIYDRDFNWIGTLVDELYSSWSPSWENQGYGSFSCSTTNPHVEGMMQPGARIVCEYDGDVLMSGPIESWRGDALEHGEVTFQVRDWHLLLTETLGWANPANPLAAEKRDSLGQASLVPGKATEVGTTRGHYGYYRFPSGPISAETALKLIVRDNLVTRLGMPVTIAPDQQRGGDVSDVLPKVRFDQLLEMFTPILDKSKLGVRLWQKPGAKTITFDVVPPVFFPQVLTPESGIIAEGAYARNAPTVTRPIVAGPGEGAARVFHSSTIGPGFRTQREKDWGRVIEVARDESSSKAEFPDDLAERFQVEKYHHLVAAAEAVADLRNALRNNESVALAEGAPTTSLTLKLSETDTFKFGPKGVPLGAIVTAKLAGFEFTEQIREAELSYTRDNGKTVTPYVGEREDDPDEQLAITVANLANALRRVLISK